MFRNITCGQVKVGSRLYTLLCESDSPLQEVYAAVTAIQSECLDRINKSKAIQEQEAQSSESEVKEPS